MCLSMRADPICSVGNYVTPSAKFSIPPQATNNYRSLNAQKLAQKYFLTLISGDTNGIHFV